MKPPSAKTTWSLAVLAAATSCLTPQAAAQSVALENAGAPLPESVATRIKDLLAQEDEAETRFEARRQARRAADIVLKVLNSEGYFDASAEISVELEPKITPKVVFSPGPRFSLSGVGARIEWPDGETGSAADAGLSPRLNAGDAAKAKDIIAEEVRLLTQLRQTGYPDARKLDRELIGDREAGEVELTYRFAPGPLVCLGEIELDNEGVTRPAMVQRLSTVTPGQDYDASALAQFERRLVQTRMFDLADVSLAPGEAAPQSICQTREVLVRLEDAPRHSAGLGVSYSTSEGAGVQADWLRRNFTGRLDTLSTTLVLAELERDFELAWEQPAFRGYGRALRLALTATEEETDAYDRTAIGVEADYDYRWTDRITLSTGVGATYSKEDDGDTERDLQVVYGLLGGTWDNTDSALDPSQGARVYVQGEPSYALGDADGAFIRSTAELRGYTGWNSDRFILAGRFKLGSVYGAEQTELPVDRRFFAGGGGSVRGYAYQALGPEDENGDPIGGRSLMEASLEGRWRFRERYGLALFVDAGEATAQELPKFSELRAGVGVGFRYYTRFGPLRLDVAAPIDRREDDDAFQVYISIGQAF